jgi:peptide deformylase
MIETMHVAEGVGLAANQVGSPLSILVASPDGKRGQELVLINPTLIKHRGRARSPEGCLSVPGVSADVSRSNRVTATGLSRQFQPVTIEAEGLLAKILQHEIDHLEGHLFLDRLRFLQRRRLLRKYRDLSAALEQIGV